MSFDITSPKITHCGAGAFSKTAVEAARVGRKAIVVTGEHLHGSKLIDTLADQLFGLKSDCLVADPIKHEPTIEMVDALAEQARQFSADVIIAVGGGSVMDTAKAAAVMATNDGYTEDYQLKRREIVNPPIAQVFAPTTAGTGSEATRVSVLTNEHLQIKRSISDPMMTPDIVILDPELTVSLPRYFTTLTAMDAFSHAIESAVSRKSTAYTRHIALASIQELCNGLPESQNDPDNLDARLACLLGSYLAGLAMQMGLGASHSLAPAICIVAGIRHSEAVAALLPHVIRLNERLLPGTYNEVKNAMGCDDVAFRLIELCKAAGFSSNLAQFGLKESDWSGICEAMNRYGSHRITNPVEVTDDFAKELFFSALDGQ
ncbi:iron-containing alcohol dehydrogenase [bacterium]|nr:iron-containing alcohol dehydrogenase [bacterium]